jgi:hypothetical protein
VGAALDDNGGSISMSAPTVISYQIAEVLCMLCGRRCGTAKRDAQNAPLLFRRQDGADWEAVRGVSRMRCPSCGGSLFLDEFEERREFTAAAFEEEVDPERPRRGRPPRPFRIPTRAA